MAELLHGVVKWFNDAKGFGFIEHTSGRDVFVHYSVIETEGFKTLKDGEQVEYELREGDKGLNAARVSRVNAPPKDKAAAQAADSIPASSQIEVERIEPSDGTHAASHHSAAEPEGEDASKS